MEDILMPITKFSWASLKENIRKFAVVYLVGILITIACTNLLWTTTRPRIPDDQSVTVYLAAEYSNPQALDKLAEQMLEDGKAYDETLEEVVFYGLTYGNPETDYTGSMVMATRLSTGEGDVYIANEYALANLQAAEAPLDLQPYLDAGWLEGLDVEPYIMDKYEVDNTGEIIGINGSYIGAIRLDNVDNLYKWGCMDNEGAYLVIACNGTNIDTTIHSVDFMLRALMEG
jgi:ABC-type glycerol-3-phosphate transport system substrate-binding protein